MIHFSYYGHVFEEFEGRDRGSAEAAIWAARDERVPVSYPSPTLNQRRSRKPLQTDEAAARIRTRDPFITRDIWTDNAKTRDEKRREGMVSL
jgi:hypothetical protein